MTVINLSRRRLLAAAAPAALVLAAPVAVQAADQALGDAVPEALGSPPAGEAPIAAVMPPVAPDPAPAVWRTFHQADQDARRWRKVKEAREAAAEAAGVEIGHVSIPAGRVLMHGGGYSEHNICAPWHLDSIEKALTEHPEHYPDATPQKVAAWRVELTEKSRARKRARRAYGIDAATREGDRAFRARERAAARLARTRATTMEGLAAKVDAVHALASAEDGCADIGDFFDLLTSARRDARRLAKGDAA